LFNLIDLCHRGAFGSYWKFAEKFFQLHQGSRGFGQEVGDLLDKGVLDEAIKYLVMGRTASEVMGQMPARQRVLKLIEAPGAERISPAKLHLFKESTGIEAACRNAVRYKLAAAVQLVLDIDKPVVLYTYRREDADKLSKLLTKAKVPNLVATGDSTTAKRDDIIQRWKMGEATALVCTMDAVRESATLVRADVMIFVDLSWLPGTMLQCEGRIDPARQPENERRPVTYYYLVTKDGPDEVVAESLVHKIEQASGIGSKNHIADSFGEFLTPLDKRSKAEEISPAAMMNDLTARLVARANRLADLGMMEDGGM
jgi:SNF2 family DNA or RNA helicase